MSRDEDHNQRISEILERRAVDEDTRDALRRARNSALAAAPRRLHPGWIPAAAVAVTIMIGIGAALLYPTITEQDLPASAFDDLVVIDSEDELELLEELEFYVWYDQQEQG